MIRESLMSNNRKPHDPVERGRKARESTVSYDIFYRDYQPRLTRFLITQASDIGMAEDAAQETMIAAYHKWEAVKGYERPDSWLFMVATRKLRRMEARARDRCSLPEDLASADDDLRIAAADDRWIDDHIDLVVALRSLPRRQCEVIGLHYLLGYTLAETARMLGIEAGTAKKHLHRGLTFLRQYHQDPDKDSKIRRKDPGLTGSSLSNG
jgi:RNA polymerase sigma factor (sigma-70 family)